MFKRNPGSALRSRRYHSQTRELRANILTHNLAMLLRKSLFYTEQKEMSMLWSSTDWWQLTSARTRSTRQESGSVGRTDHPSDAVMLFVANLHLCHTLSERILLTSF